MNVKWYLLVVLTCIPWKIGDVCSDQECSFWFVWSFGLAFYILHHGCSGNTEFPRYWRSLSLSLSTSICLLLKCLHLIPLVSHFIGLRNQATSHMFSSSLASFTPHSLGCLPCWDVQCHQISSVSHCAPQSGLESKDSKFDLLWSKCHLQIQSESFSCIFTKYAFSI